MSETNLHAGGIRTLENKDTRTATHLVTVSGAWSSGKSGHLHALTFQRTSGP